MKPRRAMCATCPFRADGYTEYGELLTKRAIGQDESTQGMPVCHSTGISPFTGKAQGPELGCRGARDIQLKLFTAYGLLPEPTDAAWTAKCAEMGLVE
jgi:hypothetical protein